MKNVVLAITLFGACSPQYEDPTGTTDTQTSTTAGGGTDGGSVTSINPTTEVEGSTGTPDTDDPPPPTTTESTTGDPPICPDDAWVMCGDEPCTDTLGKPVCNWSTCDPLPCAECPPEGTCGELFGEAVCVLGGLVPCKATCTPLLCSECPNDACEGTGSSLCTEPGSDTIVCRESLLFCDTLLDACAEDAHCADGAPDCLNGHCVALCVVDDDCGLNSICANGACLDALGNMVCEVIPHDPPAEPTCEPLGPCMSDIDCPAGASTCWDLVKNEPTMPGMIGQCISACTSLDDCFAGVMCSSKGFCADELGIPVCTLP